MKAVVLEIHKKYCVVVTEDGQFLKQDIPAGNLEIGDEIIVEKTVYCPAERNWLRKFAIAAVVTVAVGLGGFGLYKILPIYLPSMMVASGNRAVAEETLLQEVAPGEEQKAAMVLEETTAETAMDESAAGESEEPAADEEEAEEAAGDGAAAIGSVEDIREGAGEVDVIFELDMTADDQPVEVTAGNLLFFYRIIENGGGYSLSLAIENLSPDYGYSGIAALEVRTDEGVICGLGAFEFNEFSSEDEFERSISLACPGDLIRVELRGQFK